MASPDTNLLYKIAKAYYEDGLTQNQIGKRLGLSRIKVSRLLQQARQTRVVQITIVPPSDSFADLERAVEAKYGLDEVVIAADEATEEHDVLHLLGGGGAGYLTRVVEDGQQLTISWGTTLLAVIDALSLQNLPETRIVQMLGGLGKLESEVYGADLTLRMAQAFGAKMRLLPSPGIVTSQFVRDALLEDQNIAETLDLAAAADLAVVGVGSPTPDSVVLNAGILTAEELEDLKKRGAVGDIALRFFDVDGETIDHPINDRIIGLDLSQIKQIPRVIGVAGGARKFDVIRGAVVGGLINVLITDAGIAQRLVDDTSHYWDQQPMPELVNDA